MFPSFCQDLKDLGPEAYFGGCEIPEYSHVALTDASDLKEIVGQIRFIDDSSGYVDETGIHYHLPNGEEILIDLSKKFVFIAQPSVVDGEMPSPFQVLRFIQEPVGKALLVGLEGALLIEKTKAALALCRKMDRVWQDGAVSEQFSNDEREPGDWLLVKFMKIYESKEGESTEMWEFWPTFSVHLMQDRLRLRVRVIN